MQNTLEEHRGGLEETFQRFEHQDATNKGIESSLEQHEKVMQDCHAEIHKSRGNEEYLYKEVQELKSQLQSSQESI